MTRKRFIKLLISYGQQRNEAAQIAKSYNAKGFSYEEAHNDCYIKFQLANDIINGNFEGLKNFDKNFQRVAILLYELAEGIYGRNGA